MKNLGEKPIPAHAVVRVSAPVTTPLHFDDNRIGQCHFCEQDVQFRPHGPEPDVLVCTPCFLERFEPGKDSVLVTDRSLREVTAWMNRN